HSGAMAHTVLGLYSALGDAGRRDEEIHLGSRLTLLVYPEHHLKRVAEDYWGVAGKQLRMLGVVPVGGELVGNSYDDPAVVEAQRVGRLEPGPERLIRDLLSSEVEQDGPDFGSCQGH